MLQRAVLAELPVSRSRAWARVARVAGSVLLTMGCGAGPASPLAPTVPLSMVTGQVTYLQRVALSPSAVVDVTLADVSRADAPAVVIATQRIETLGRQVPFAFALAYDPARIDQRFTYAVSARISDAGRLLFVSTRRYAVITGGSPQADVEIVVDPAA